MFKKLFKILLIIFIIALVVIATGGVGGAFSIACSDFLVSAGFPVLGSFVTSIAALGIPWYVATAAGLGLGYLIWPDATIELISDIGTVAETVGTTVAGVVGATGSALVGSFLTGTGGLILLGLAAFFLLSGSDRKEKRTDDEESSDPTAALATAPYAEAQ